MSKVIRRYGLPPGSCIPRLIVSLTLLLVPSLVSVESTAGESQPRVLYIERDACPFEGCQFGEWVAESPLRAYAKEADTRSIMFRIRPGEKIVALRGNLHVTKPGRVLMREEVTLGFPPHTFKKGERLYVLSYRGEGQYLVSYKGNLMKVEVFWDEEPEEASMPLAILEEPPQMIWWVLVKNAKGQQGWLRLRNTATLGFGFEERIEGVDALR